MSYTFFIVVQLLPTKLCSSIYEYLNWISPKWGNGITARVKCYFEKLRVCGGGGDDKTCVNWISLPYRLSMRQCPMGKWARVKDVFLRAIGRGREWCNMRETWDTRIWLIKGLNFYRKWQLIQRGKFFLATKNRGEKLNHKLTTTHSPPSNCPLVTCE